MKRKLLLLLCVLFTAFTSIAQNTTNLPTSMYGVGELSTSDGGKYAGMGNLGIALNRPGFQNTQNPAAITRMDTACFTFDIGMTTSYSRYSFQSASSSNLSGNPNRISMGFRIFPRWYTMIGVAPFSSVGYIIQTEEPVEGTANAVTYSSFEGTGGLYRLYVTNAFALTRHLSVGANLGIVSGTIDQSETQETAIVQYESAKKAFYADFGIHYNFLIDKKEWAIGLVYAPSTVIKQDNELTYSSSSTTQELEENYHSRTQYLPMHIGAGISMTSKRWILTADYNYLDWSKNSSSYTSVKYENQQKINIGAAYITNPRLSRSTELMGGIGLSNSYITLKKGEMKYLEVSAGASFPIRYSHLSINAAWRKQVNSRNNLMQESKWSVNLNLTFGEKISRFKLR